MRLFRTRQKQAGPQSVRAATLQPKKNSAYDDKDLRKAEKLLRTPVSGPLLKSIQEDLVLGDSGDDSASDFSAKIPSGSFDDSCSQSSDSFEEHSQAPCMYADRDSSQATHLQKHLAESARWGELFDDLEGSCSTKSECTEDLLQSREEQAGHGHATLLPRQCTAGELPAPKQKPESPNSVLIDVDSTAAGATARQTASARAGDSIGTADHGSMSPGALARMCQQTQHVLASSMLACTTSLPHQPDGRSGRVAAHTRDATAQHRTEPSTSAPEVYSGKGEGLGSCSFENGDCYQGSLQDGTPHGLGLYHFHSLGKYAGQWQHGVFDGHGVESFADGAMYVGCYADGMAHGHGICLYQDGSIYEGQFERGLPAGRGMHKCRDGSSYAGIYCQGQRSGQGIYLYANGDRYMGAWQADVPHGLGRYHSARGGLYAGQYCEGVKEGWGISTAASGMQFVGRWSEGTCMWQSGIDPRDASWRNTASQAQNQRFSAALAAAAQAAGSAEQALQLVGSHVQEVKGPTRAAVLQAQAAATAAEAVQSRAAAAAQAFRRMTGQPQGHEHQLQPTSASKLALCGPPQAATLPILQQESASAKLTRSASAASSVSARDVPGHRSSLNPILVPRH